MCTCVYRVCAGCVYKDVCTGCVQGMYTGVYAEACIGLCVQRYGPVHVSRGVSGGVCVHS